MLCEAADDIGKALGLPPSGLTLTIGFGPSLFRDADGADRFGSAGQRPAVLATCLVSLGMRWRRTPAAVTCACMPVTMTRLGWGAFPLEWAGVVLRARRWLGLVALAG